MRIDEVEGPNKHAGLIKEKYKKELLEAYSQYQQGHMSTDRLLLLVREFAIMKLRHLEFQDSGFAGVGTATDLSDWAQHVVIRVSKVLEKNSVRGSFYALCHKIAYNAASDFFNDLKDNKDKRVPLTADQEDDDGVIVDELNPEVYENAIQPNYGRRFVGVKIPPEVQGVDRMICLLLLTRTTDCEGNERGRTYREIAKALRMSASAVEKRMSRLKERLVPIRERDEQELLASRRARDAEHNANQKRGGRQVGK